MKITIDQKQLKGLLSRLSGITKGANLMPILRCVLLTAKGNKFTVSATDLEIGLQVTCIEDVEIVTPGQIAVPAAKLREIVDTLSGEITLSVLDNLRLEITCGDFISRLACEDPAGFPNIPSNGRSGWQSFTLHADDLQSMVNACTHSMSTDEKVIKLCGIYFTVENGRFLAVSTNVHCLSLAGREFPEISGLEKGIIVPRKGIEEIRKLQSESIGLHIGKNKVEIVQGDTFLSIRLVDADFPAFRSVIPDKYQNYCTVQRSSLIDAVSRVRLFDKAIVLRIEGKAIVIRAVDKETSNEGIDAVTCQITGDSVTVKVNAPYLLDALSSLEGSEVVIKYKDELSPLLLLPADFKKWDERLCVVMPQRL